MKLVVKELEEWVNEFYEVASYHHGEYKEGMIRVLDGVKSQLNTLRSIEKTNIKDSFSTCCNCEGTPLDAEEYYNETFDNSLKNTGLNYPPHNN